MPDPPPEAVQAAAEVLTKALAVPGQPVTPGQQDTDWALSRLMLEAAAPHIAAAERERIAKLAEQHGPICARLPDQPLAVTTSGAVTAWDGTRESPVISFADLLRQDQP